MPHNAVLFIHQDALVLEHKLVLRQVGACGTMNQVPSDALRGPAGPPAHVLVLMKLLAADKISMQDRPD
jgi:hypothetical protein